MWSAGTHTDDVTDPRALGGLEGSLAGFLARPERSAAGRHPTAEPERPMSSKYIVPIPSPMPPIQKAPILLPLPHGHGGASGEAKQQHIEPPHQCGCFCFCFCPASHPNEKRRDPCGFLARGVTPAPHEGLHHQISNALIRVVVEPEATPGAHYRACYQLALRRDPCGLFCKGRDAFSFKSRHRIGAPTPKGVLSTGCAVSQHQNDL